MSHIKLVFTVVTLFCLLGEVAALQDPTGNALYAENFVGMNCFYGDGIGGPGLQSIVNGASTGTATSDFRGNFYILDFENSKIWWRDTAGTVRCIAGNGMRGFLDGPGDQARFFMGDDEYADAQIVADTCGHVFVSDYRNKRLRMLSRDADGVWWVTTLAGGGTKVPKKGAWLPADSAQDGCAQNFGVSLDGKAAYFANATGLIRLDIRGSTAKENRMTLLIGSNDSLVRNNPDFSCGLASWKSAATLAQDGGYYWMPSDPSMILRYDTATGVLERFAGTCDLSSGDGYRLNAGFFTVHMHVSPSGNVIFTGGPGDENNLRRIYQDTVKHLGTTGSYSICGSCSGWGKVPLHIDQSGYLYYCPAGNQAIYRIRFADTDTSRTPLAVESNLVSATPVLTLTAVPNPFSNSIRLSILGKGLKKETPIQFDIFDINGRLVGVIPANATVSQLESVGKMGEWHASHLPCGLYFVQVKTGRSVLISKITLLR